MSLLPPDVGRTDEPGMKKSHEVYGRFDRAKKALCAASSKGKEAVLAAAKEFGIAKDEYDKLPNRHGILGGRRRRKTRGGACGVSNATLSGLGLVYMGNCLWQHRDKKAISHVPKGFTKTTLHGKPAYHRNPGGGRKTRRR